MECVGKVKLCRLGYLQFLLFLGWFVVWLTERPVDGRVVGVWTETSEVSPPANGCFGIRESLVKSLTGYDTLPQDDLIHRRKWAGR